MGLRRRSAVVLIAVLVLYYILGAFVFPPLLLPIGCSGTFGTPAVETAPTTGFNISYDSQNERLIVEHTDGEVISQNWTEQVTIVIESPEDTRGVTWTQAGGTYPIRDGDSISISNISLSNDTGQSTTVSVQWTGDYLGETYPIYCPSPYDGDTTVSDTLQRSDI